MQWQVKQQRWHSSYPAGVSPSINYEMQRVESLLLAAAAKYPRRHAVRYFQTHWSYEELVQRIRQAAGNLKSLGIGPGDRVLMVLPNCPEFVVTWFALHWLGAEVIPANPLMSGHEIAFLAETSRARAVFGLDVRLKPVLEALQLHPLPLLVVVSLAPHLPASLRWAYHLKRMRKRMRVPQSTHVKYFKWFYGSAARPLTEPLLAEADLPAVLQPTGGTTGTPKIAVLTHKNLLANVAQLHLWCGLQPGEEVVLAVLPFFHVFGSTVAMLSPLAGGSTLLLQAKFTPARILKLMDRYKPGVAPMVPFMFATLSEEMERRGRDMPGLKICFSGAAALPSEVKEDFERRTGATIIEGFGLSEASPVTHSNPPDEAARPGTIGVPMPDTVARIVDQETGLHELPLGEVGELVIRGPQIMAGYLGQEEETRQMIRDGWLYTGDLATMDADGFFSIVDRKKDMIISGGLNIFPTEIEEVLSSHPDVEECAVVGLPDKKYGETVVAYVIPRPGKTLNPDELKRYCKGHLASYKIPRIMEQCSELPRNFLGKVRRVELRSRAA